MTTTGEGKDSTWRDDPISSRTEDTLGRGHLAKRAADLIVETHSWESSVVLGLVGRWGSGKSSVLSLTINELHETSPDWKVVRFTPWAAGDTSGLLAEFFAALSAALPEKRFEGFKSGLADVIEVAAPAAGALPGLGSVASGGAKWFSKWLRKQKPWAHVFSEASNTLKELRTPVLVVADDIDRLQGDELLGFLKVVRLLGRFPGISYLLAYDETSLKKTIASAANGVSGSGSSHDFLEKFVQYPIYLPQLLPGQTLRQLDMAISEASEGTGHTIAEGDRRLGEVGDVWTTYVDTPRAIKRFGAQLRLVLPLHRPGEIDLVDLILLTLLRVYFSDVYCVLPHNGARLVSPKSIFGGSSTTSFEWTGIVDPGTTDASADAVRKVLMVIFPNIQYPGRTEAKRPRAAHPQYFDRYFYQAVPEDDVSDHEVHAALEAASSGDIAPLQELLTTNIGDRVDTAISKLWTFSTSGDESIIPTTTQLLGGVMELLPSLSASSASIFNQQGRAATWAKELLLSLAPVTSQRELEDALRRCSDLKLIVDVLWSASGDESRLPPAASAFRTILASDVLDAFMDHLALKDAAPLDFPAASYAYFLAQFGTGVAIEQLRSRAGTTFDGDDYAARFVTLSHTISNNPISRIQDFAIAPFQTLTAFDDSFFTEGKPADVDVSDTGWQNRKAYARGRARLTDG